MTNTHHTKPDQPLTTDMLFAGSIPEIYDQCLVPLIFESYARDLAERVAHVRPRQVLETAAGTGVLTRAMTLRLPAHALIVATDPNQPMLDYAAKTSPCDDRVTWRQADAQALPFGDETFDAVACQFGVMFFPDKLRAYREAHRVLRPGGQFVFNVWDHIVANAFAYVVTQAVAELFPSDPPLFLARTPHGYHNVEAIKEALGVVGFTSILVEVRDDVSGAFSPRQVAIAYCQGTPLRNEIEARDASRLEETTQFAAEELARRFGNGSIEGRIRAQIFVAIR